MSIYVIRQEKVKNFIFLWDEPIKKANNDMGESYLRLIGQQ